MILKGQNLRIGYYDTTGQGIDYILVAGSTNCTVNLNSNTEDANHKNIVGMAANPTVVSKSWSVQVEALDVSDVGALLTLIKNNNLLAVQWDETSTTDNTTAQQASFGRKGFAYINDATFTFDNRTNSVKNIQMTGIGELETVSSADIFVPGGDVSLTKGQFVRLFLSSDNTAAPASVLGSALSLSLHVSVQLESATTKDTEGDWEVQEPVGLSYDISCGALVRGSDTITSSVGAKSVADLETIYENGEPVKWAIANTSGANNRTKGAVIASGSCLIQSLTLNGPNRQNANYQASLLGVGNYTVGS